MASEAITRQRDDMTFGLNNFIAQETSPSRVSELQSDIYNTFANMKAVQLHI